MQNDFITGSLANPDAEKIVPGIVELIKNWDGVIITTQDTHSTDYLEKREGKMLPIEHCIDGHDGWLIVSDIAKVLNMPKYTYAFYKNTFGSIILGTHIRDKYYDEIYLCGTCTDICVISNAIICKTFAPESRIVVLKDLCAGTTPENHENALKAMAQCQIDIE